MMSTQISENHFIPTLNKMGFMTSQLDPFSKEFVEESSQSIAPVLEIGAAYGVASLQALKRGAKVIANDLDPRHLEILEKSAPISLRSHLTLFPGAFPKEMPNPPQPVSAILICRVLHFFDGAMIEESARRLFELLQPGGKLYLVADTPYLRVFQEFLPHYQERKSQQDPWPGLIRNLAQYAPNRAPHLPNFFHALDPDVLRSVLEKAGFRIEKLEFFSQSHYPADIRLDGREGVGCIAIRPNLEKL